MNTLTIVDLHQADELSHSSMARVVGGDDRGAALVGLYKVLDQIELDEIDVEPVQHVPMKL